MAPSTPRAGSHIRLPRRIILLSLWWHNFSNRVDRGPAPIALVGHNGFPMSCAPTPLRTIDGCSEAQCANMFATPQSGVWYGAGFMNAPLAIPHNVRKLERH